MRDQTKTYLVCCAALLFLFASSLHAEDTIKREQHQDDTQRIAPFYQREPAIYVMDFLIPAYTTWHKGFYGEAALITFFRTAPLVIAWNSYNEAIAREAELKAVKSVLPFYGEGSVYYSFYDHQYVTYSEMSNRTGRARYRHGVAVTLYSAFTIYSLIRTFVLCQAGVEQKEPLLVPETLQSFEDTGDSLRLGYTLRINF